MPPRRKTKTVRKSKTLPAALVALMACVLLGVFVLQYAYPATSGPADAPPPRPDLARLLPRGARTSADAIAYIDDPVAPAFAVGFLLDGRASVGLVAWDRAESAYRLMSSVELAANGTAMTALPLIRTDAVALGGPRVVLAGAAVAGGGSAVGVLVSGGDTLSFAGRKEQDASLQTALFADGSAYAPDESLALEDLDADGKKELVVRRTADGGEVISAYRWDGSFFVFESDLSRALRLRKDLFLEPAQ